MRVDMDSDQPMTEHCRRVPSNHAAGRSSDSAQGQPEWAVIACSACPWRSQARGPRLGLSWSKRNHRVRAVEKVGPWIQKLMQLTGCAVFIGPLFPRARLGALSPLTLPLSSMAVTALGRPRSAKRGQTGPPLTRTVGIFRRRPAVALPKLRSPYLYGMVTKASPCSKTPPACAVIRLRLRAPRQDGQVRWDEPGQVCSDERPAFPT